ncbi:MAG: hypothetical protein KAT77_02830 [Nanoarchaeota archaeon]|nr:hypothetical protein [Nanoarchaeota archaeon]
MKNYYSKDYLIKQLKIKDYLQIAKENNVDPSTVQRWLRKYNLTSEYDYWTSDELKLLKNNYNFDKNVYALFPNRSKSSIYHKASRLGFKKEVRENNCEINQDFFKKWNVVMAYVFGWFCSDGFVSSNKDLCGIHLHSKDKEILEKIKKVMGSEHNIHDYKESSFFRVHNKPLCEDLINLGCHPKKSAILKFPYVPDKFLSHFVRGYFDGDGSIYFNKPNTIKVAFTASKEFVETLQKKLNRILGLRIGPPQKNLSVWTCFYYGDNARKLCRWMYRDCRNFYLRRKKEKFKSHIKIREKDGIQTSNIGENGP